jgi:hypothetical protein
MNWRKNEIRIQTRQHEAERRKTTAAEIRRRIA